MGNPEPDAHTFRLSKSERRVLAQQAQQSPTNIAFCITDLDVGGAEKALVEIVTRLDRTRWNPAVICLRTPGELVRPLEDADIPVTCLGSRTGATISTLVALRQRLRDFKPALLQTFLIHANLAGRLCAPFAGVKTVVAGIRVADPRSRLALGLDRWTRWLVDCNVCVSQAVAEFSIAESGLRPDKVVVIRNGVNFEKIAHAAPRDLTELGVPPNATVLLFVGRLEPQKNPKLILRAVARLVADDQSDANDAASAAVDLHVVIAGIGPLRSELASLADTLKIGHRIHIVGTQSDVAGLMAASDALVLPSRWEGLPNVVLEAMAAGLPIVATDVDGTSELIENGQTGLLVPPDDDAALVQAIAAVLNDPESASARAKSAKIVSQEWFTWDAVAAEYDALYRRLVHDSPKS